VYQATNYLSLSERDIKSSFDIPKIAALSEMTPGPCGLGMKIRMFIFLCTLSFTIKTVYYDKIIP